MISVPCCIDDRFDDCGAFPEGLYVFQNIRTDGHRPLRLAEHIRCLQEAAQEMFGTSPHIDARATERSIERLLHDNDYSATMPSHIAMRHYRTGETALIARETLPYTRMTMRSIYPAAAIVDYDIPFSRQPSSLRESIVAAASLQAAAAGARCVLQRNAAGEIVAADDAPMFVVAERDIIMPEQLPSVEADIAVEAIRKAGFHLATASVTADLLARADELFYVDYRGLTAVSRCGERVYMHIIAERIAQHL